MAVEIVDWLTMTGGYDIVRGQNKSIDQPLPFIPADRLKLGARVHGSSLGGIKSPYVGADAQFVAEQTQTADFETRTAGYTVVGFKVGGEIPVMSNRVTVDAGRR